MLPTCRDAVKVQVCRKTKRHLVFLVVNSILELLQLAQLCTLVEKEANLRRLLWMTRPFRIFSTSRLLLWRSNFPNLHNCGFFRLNRFIYLSLSTALQVPTAKTVLKWGRNIKKYFNSKICSCRLIKLFALEVLLHSFFVLLEFEMIGLNCWCAISKKVARIEIKVFR